MYEVCTYVRLFGRGSGSVLFVDVLCWLFFYRACELRDCLCAVPYCRVATVLVDAKREWEWRVDCGCAASGSGVAKNQQIRYRGHTRMTFELKLKRGRGGGGVRCGFWRLRLCLRLSFFRTEVRVLNTGVRYFLVRCVFFFLLLLMWFFLYACMGNFAGVCRWVFMRVFRRVA